MAAVENVKTEKTAQNLSSFEVITLSSDEEESEENHEDLGFWFKRFILACRPHVTKEAITNMRKIFTEVEGNLSGSQDLVSMLQRYSKEIKKENASVYFELICNALGEENSCQKSAACNRRNVDEMNISPVVNSDNSCDVNSARDFEQINKASVNKNEHEGPSNNLTSVFTVPDDDDDDDDFVSEMPRDHRDASAQSTSSRDQDDKPMKTKGKIATKKLSDKQKKKLVARLKQRLKEINNEIKILNRAELTLEEMEMSDSTYIQEHRLKVKFEKTWNKLCRVLGRPPNTGRVIEKCVRASSTGYKMIDKAIAKFLKEKRGSFPDFFDIRDVVLKTNEKHDLRMSPQVLNSVIADVFTDVGNKLQKMREKDLLFNFGSHLLDDFKMENDPALANEELARKLENNRRISKRNLKKVYAKYTRLERHGIDRKSRKYEEMSPSMVGSSGLLGTDNDMSSNSGTSEDEGDNRKSENQGESSMQCFSQVANGDMDCESSTEDEQELSETLTESSILIEDSDAVSSQDYTILSATVEPSTETSMSKVESSLANLDRSESPTFPLCCPDGRDKDETIARNQTKPNPTLEHDLSNHASNNTRAEHIPSIGSECGIISEQSEHQSICEEEIAVEDCLIIEDKHSGVEVSSTCHNEQSDTSKPRDELDIKVDEVRSLSKCKGLCEVSTQPSNISSASTIVPSSVCTNVSTITDKTETNPLTCTTSKSCDSLPKTDTKGNVNENSPRKRKATTDLAITVAKSSISCLEKIAMALKNKKLKLPEGWADTTKEQKNSVSFLANPATSTETTTVDHSLSKNNLPAAVNCKAKIDLQHRQVFREKILNALKLPAKSSCSNNADDTFQPASNETASSICLPASVVENGLQSRTNTGTTKCEVIVIDDD